MKRLYVLMIDNDTLNSKSFTEIMIGNNYNWKELDHVYFTLNEAVEAKSWIPKEIRDKVIIHEFIDNGEVH